jgi:hypothetical protein
MSMRLPVLQGTTPVMTSRPSLPSLASEVASTHAAATAAAAKRRTAFDAICRSATGRPGEAKVRRNFAGLDSC